MCLIAFSFDPGHHDAIILAANRDEFLSRPTLDPAWWSDHPGIFGGRDSLAGGTWMAVSLPVRLPNASRRTCRFAALTNVRRHTASRGAPPSRGHLITRLLGTETGIEQTMRQIAGQGSRYNGYNLIAFEWQQEFGRLDEAPSALANLRGWHLSNSGPYSARPMPIESGVHSVSNGAYDEEWPKTRLLSNALHDAIVARNRAEADRILLDALQDSNPARDDQLPDTGVGTIAERELSPPFIRARFEPGNEQANYGTRTSTLFNLGQSGQCRFRQFRWDSHAASPSLIAAREMQSAR